MSFGTLKRADFPIAPLDHKRPFCRVCVVHVFSGGALWVAKPKDKRSSRGTWEATSRGNEEKYNAPTITRRRCNPIKKSHSGEQQISRRPLCHGGRTRRRRDNAILASISTFPWVESKVEKSRVQWRGVDRCTTDGKGEGRQAKIRSPYTLLRRRRRCNALLLLFFSP